MHIRNGRAAAARMAGVALLAATLVLSNGPAGAQFPDPVRFAVTVEAGNADAARSWLEEGLDPDFLGDRIGTGLMIAAWNGDLALMELFVSHGADVNFTNGAGEQALMHAAWKGRLEAVRWLVDRGAAINRDGREWSALHYAVFAGHEEVARFLIERGADVNSPSTNGSSPLMMAAREGRESLARMLLDRGADPALANERGENAMVWAMHNRHYTIARLVADAEQFSQAVRQPPEPVVKSEPAPSMVEEALARVRAAEAEGRPTEDLREALWNAVAEARKDSRALTPDVAPRGLVIRAKKGTAHRGKESVELIYDEAPKAR